jgi:hypothetical protein
MLQVNVVGVLVDSGLRAEVLEEADLRRVSLNKILFLKIGAPCRLKVSTP